MRYVVLGATGSVGRVLLRLLADRLCVSPEQVVALASTKGAEVSMGEDAILKVQRAADFCFQKNDLVFSAVRASLAEEIIPKALKAGARVIDKSAAFRQTAPLVVPEVNADLLEVAEGESPQLIASPNCVVIPLVVATHPLAMAFGLKRLVVATYQAVSGAGKKGLDTLYAETKKVLMADAPSLEGSPFPKQIAFNVLPQIGPLDADGVSDEEDKIQKETQKILSACLQQHRPTGDASFEITATAVRVPTFMSHGIAVVMETEEAFELREVEALLQDAQGVVLRHDHLFTPMDASSEDSVFITRLRQMGPRTLAFWVVCDNLLKGAALNAIQIAEALR